MAATTVTNSGPSVITGNVGVSPGSAVTGFGPGGATVIGSVFTGAASPAGQAQADLTTAYNDAAARGPALTVATELGGTTRGPGVYDSADGTFQITGPLTLDAHGDPNAVFIFKMAATLNTAAGSSVLLAGGAQACNVFWQVGSSASLGTTTSFQGNILALTSISVNTGATIVGRALARGGAVTLLSNIITAPTCQAFPPTSAAATVTHTVTRTVTAQPTVRVTRTVCPSAGIGPNSSSHSNSNSGSASDSDIDIDSNGHQHHHQHHHHHS
ncbi:ice-binding family protein [Actinomadura scrupuli]|uniref:ice-binding family protein n=1 Tax=Actinomadura scrupuli TaxID=559629 RepID=UPI003D993E4C